MSPDLFDELLPDIKEKITTEDTKWRKAIPLETKLQITLRFLATGEDFESLALQFRVGESTVGKIVRLTSAAIWQVLGPKYVKFPQTQEEWLQIAKDFEEQWQLPFCLGAIDGKHVRMQKPKNTHSLNFNYKKFFSKVLFACVDANYKFIYVDMGSFGSEGDAAILQKSSFGKALDGNQLNLPPTNFLPNSTTSFPYFFIGDQAFPLKLNLLRPYKVRNITNAQKVFNYRICRARRVVENAFGILANRYRMFRGELHASEETNNIVVMAALTLHNFLINKKCEMYCPLGFVDSESMDINHTPVNGSWRYNFSFQNQLIELDCTRGNRIYKNATENRDKLCNYFQLNPLSWQNIAIERGYYM